MKSVLIIILAASLAVACGESDQRDTRDRSSHENSRTGPTSDTQDSSQHRPQNNSQDQTSTSQDYCNTTPKPERCTQKAKGYTFSRASYLNSMKFPSDAKVDTLFDNQLGSAINGITALMPSVNVNQSIQNNIDNGNLKIILEFDGWAPDQDTPPTDKDVMLWAAAGTTKPTENSSVTLNKNSVSSEVVSKSYFKKATFTPNAGKYEVQTEKGELILPIDFSGISLELTLQEAQFHGTLIPEGKGIKIEKGKFAGHITEDNFKKGILDAQSSCPDTCVTVTHNTCTQVATTPNDTNCPGPCQKLHLLCNPVTSNLALGLLFNKAKTPVGSAVLEVTGVPVEISGISP